MAVKLYDSKAWLQLQHHVKKKSIEQIAKECKVQPLTIRRKMDGFGIRIVKYN